MFDLMLIADGLPADALLAVVERALAGAAPGRVAVQLRAKNLPRGARRALAVQLRACTEAHAAPLMVNGDLELAMAVGAEGVHLPQAGPTSQDARRAVGPRRLVGVSCHDLRELERAARGGADLVTLSPVFPVAGKAPPLGVEGFARLAATVALPVFALGGVDAAAIPALRAAGAHGAAVVSAVTGAASPKDAVRALCHALDDDRR